MTHAEKVTVLVVLLTTAIVIAVMSSPDRPSPEHPDGWVQVVGDLSGLTVERATDAMHAAGIENVVLRPESEPVGLDWTVVGHWPSPDVVFPPELIPRLRGVLYAEP